MYREADARVEESDGINAVLRDIRGVEIGVFLREKHPEEVKVGLRSKKYIDVSEICAKFGGGGHKHAAGCTIHKTMEETIPLIREAVEESYTAVRCRESGSFGDAGILAGRFEPPAAVRVANVGGIQKGQAFAGRIYQSAETGGDDVPRCGFRFETYIENKKDGTYGDAGSDGGRRPAGLRRQGHESRRVSRGRSGRDAAASSCWAPLSDTGDIWGEVSYDGSGAAGRLTHEQVREGTPLRGRRTASVSPDVFRDKKRRKKALRVRERGDCGGGGAPGDYRL